MIPTEERILRLIGLARRAGKISYGFEGVTKDIKKHKTKLIIFSEEISERTKNEILKNAVGIQTLTLSASKEEIGNAIGTKPTAALSLNDGNFKKGITEVK